MANQGTQYFDTRKMFEHGFLIDVQKGIEVTEEPMVIVPAMRTTSGDFIFKRLVAVYGFDPDTTGTPYTLRVYVTHADVQHYQVRKLAKWDGQSWVVLSNSLISLQTPHPLWEGYFEVTMKIGDPPVALGE